MPRRNPGAHSVDPESVRTLKNHCVYSLAVLLLLLLGDKYHRPAYAQTGNVDEVYAAIAERKDSDYWLTVSKNLEGPHTGGKKVALKSVLSTFNAQQQEEFLLSWMDNFKLQVTEVLSSHEPQVTVI